VRPAAGRGLLAELIRREAAKGGKADVKEIMRRHGVEYTLEAALSLAREAGFSDEEIVYDVIRDTVYVRRRPRIPAEGEPAERRPRRAAGFKRGRGLPASGKAPQRNELHGAELAKKRGAGRGKTLLDFAGGPDGDTKDA